MEPDFEKKMTGTPPLNEIKLSDLKNKKLNKDKLFSALNKGFFNFNFDIKYL